MKLKLKIIPGFTLVELMVVCGLIALLSTLTILGINAFKEKSENERRIANVQQLQIALEKYRSVCGVYPKDDGDENIILATQSNTFGGGDCVDGNNTDVTFGSFAGDLVITDPSWYFYEATRRTGTGISACEGYQLAAKLLSGNARYGNGIAGPISSVDWQTCDGYAISSTDDIAPHFYYVWGPR